MRTTRRVEPTEAGRRLQASSVSVLRQVEDAIGEVTRSNTEPSGVLRVAAPHDDGTSRIAPLAAAFSGRHPACQVELILADTRIDPIASQIDLSIRVGWLDDSSLHARRIGGFRQCLVATPELARTLAVADPDDLAQLSVAYPDSPLNENHLDGLRDVVHRRAPRPGERAPDAAVIAQHGACTTLFAHLYNPDGVTWGWTLLLFDARRQDALAAMRRALAQVRDWEWMRPRSILGKSVPEAGDATALFDLDGVAHGAYGIEGAPALVLVRPDGHIAFRGPLDKPELLRAYCGRVFGA
jgi:DNA-binding transcriptional LysR family regulator